MKKTILAILLVFATVLLTSCSEETPQIEKTYVYTESNNTEGTVSLQSYSLELYDDKTFKMTKTESLLTKNVMTDTATVITFGTYIKSDSAIEGSRTVTLSVPERVLFNAYSPTGGYTFDFDTDTDSQYTIPDSEETAVNESEFREYYGLDTERTVYLKVNSEGVDTCRFSFKAEE